MSSSAEKIRNPTHSGPAGGWYSGSKSQLSSQVDGWLDAVKPPIKCIGPQSEGEEVTDLPVKGARVIIAPHAGYAYSGPAAAWAYKAWDVSKAKRIFLLGPSHHYHLTKAALSKCTHYGTPLGNLTVDRETTSELYKTGLFEWMSQSVDEEEHSLEMHLPYIHKTLDRTFGTDASSHPLLIPIMIGNTTPATERKLAQALAPYLQDPTTAFVISSDFCHWGSRFRYTYYQPLSGPSLNLPSSWKPSRGDRDIHESIKAVDFECIGACETGSHDTWTRCLEGNGNTVCGRHPIGVVMAAMEEVGSGGRFRFVRYERSSEVRRVGESSVSYASAFAVV